MGNIDLNKAEDFARLTMSSPLELAGQLGALIQALGRNKDEWEILEGKYRGGRKNAEDAYFHIFTKKTDPTYQAGVQRVVDQGGRRKAKFAYPYVDGHTTDDLGRRGAEFTVDCVIHGNNYKWGLKKLQKEIDDPIPGELMHPVLGIIPCSIENFSRVHEHSARNAVTLTLHFTEHNFSAEELSFIIAKPTTRSALQETIAMIQRLTAAIAAIKQIAGIAQGVVNTIRAHYEALTATFQDLVADSASAYGVTARDVAAVLPLQQGGNLVPRSRVGDNPSTLLTSGVGGTSITDGNFIRVSDRFTAIVAPADPFANLPLDLLSDVARQAIEQTQLERRVESMREQTSALLKAVDEGIELTQSASAGLLGRAAAAVVTLTDARVTALAACDSIAQVLRAGAASGRPQIINYRLQRDMSIREVAFENGLSADDGNDISLLNPFIESVNNIPKDTVLKVPVVL